MKKTIVSIFVFIFTIGNAQKQNYNWIFGVYNGLTWKEKQHIKVKGLFGTPDAILTDLPTSLSNPMLNTVEGTFTISDLNGNLLLYSDGANIYNKNNDAISGGLGGNSTSTQSGSIVLYPGEVNKYIAISAGFGNGVYQGLFYTIIDMNLNGGLGGIPNYPSTATPLRHLPFTGAKGILGETVTAGRHANRKDIWVLAPSRTSAAYPGKTALEVWAINSTNASEFQNTVHSSFELDDVITFPNNPGGYIRFTNDTKHFAWINFGDFPNPNGEVFLCIGDFDNETGTISNVRIKRNVQIDETSNGYGVEFTNDNKYLYITLSPPGPLGKWTSHLIVYDFEELLNTNSEQELLEVAPLKVISTPAAVITTSPNLYYGALQTSPDGRMYIANMWKNSVLVIDNPKDPVNMRLYELPTAGATRYGLPNFAVPWFTTGVEINQDPNSLCANKQIPIDFYIVDGEGYEQVDKITVDYGDGITQTDLVPLTPGIHSKKHTYSNPGMYNIKMDAYKADNTVFTSFDKTLIINSCSVKVNPFIRGEFKS
ncbi:hypothetical protein K5I29_13135 [Flavobacterium agricola]|uniref:PKD domain-containing protein n=1 Tax=Flavobacterium agricola TaxID=2870839 RepID=A0ABY6M324_9FLAO|nr:hypothetical protein [Flavobacterium agricola]UYW01358.1 hypothetical protein K5I29_13135 [Flavobacterium agricola]